MALTQMRPTLSLVETFFLAKYLETLVNVDKYVYWSSFKAFRDYRLVILFLY